MKEFRPRNVTVAAALLAVLATPLGGSLAPSMADAATSARILTCAQKPTAKPSTYTISCADANAGWTGVTWSAWGPTSATGHGFLRQNDCTPTCVAGKFVNYRATVTLSKVVTTNKYGALFSRATIRDTAGGRVKIEVFSLID